MRPSSPSQLLSLTSLLLHISEEAVEDAEGPSEAPADPEELAKDQGSGGEEGQNKRAGSMHGRPWPQAFSLGETKLHRGNRPTPQLIFQSMRFQARQRGSFVRSPRFVLSYLSQDLTRYEDQASLELAELPLPLPGLKANIIIPCFSFSFPYSFLSTFFIEHRASAISWAAAQCCRLVLLVLLLLLKAHQRHLSHGSWLRSPLILSLKLTRGSGGWAPVCVWGPEKGLHILPSISPPQRDSSIVWQGNILAKAEQIGEARAGSAISGKASAKRGERPFLKMTGSLS